MESLKTQYVWYASYGSNLLRERFLCYITGGTPEGATRHNTGATDKTLPLKDRAVRIPYPLYFAKASESWQGGGVAFIADKRNEANPALGRMYLITAEQFIQVVRQENGMEPEDESLTMDLGEIEKQGESVIGTGWYGKLVCLGREESYPIFTFTSPSPFDPNETNCPRENYLRTIGRGIQQTYGLNENEIINYFLNTPGVSGNWSKEELKDQINL